MRVLFTNEAPLIKYGLAEGFRQAGHEVKVIMGEDSRLWGYSLQEQKRRLKHAIDQFKPDFVFTEGSPGFDAETVCHTISQHSIPHCYWAIEDPVSHNTSLLFANMADQVFTTTIECLPDYQRLGKPAEILLFGCNPDYHRNAGIIPELHHDIVLVASNYSSRYEEVMWFVMPLVEKGYDIKIWGIWWDDDTRPVTLNRYPSVYGGLLPYEMLPQVYSSAAIVLGVNCDSSSQTQTSMRPYEALACGGGVFLAHYTPAQENLFGSLIYQVRNTEETLQMVDYLLSLSVYERHEIARTAQNFVYSHHTYNQRAHQIVDAYCNLVGLPSQR